MCNGMRVTGGYLLNRDEYARNDASPRPELSDVSTTPRMASHWPTLFA